MNQKEQYSPVVLFTQLFPANLLHSLWRWRQLVQGKQGPVQRANERVKCLSPEFLMSPRSIQAPRSWLRDLGSNMRGHCRMGTHREGQGQRSGFLSSIRGSSGIEVSTDKASVILRLDNIPPNLKKSRNRAPKYGFSKIPLRIEPLPKAFSRHSGGSPYVST